jgi:two-component system chemotaxis response regulator CheY
MKDGKFVVLCADDDHDILQTLQLLLERNGYSMVSASTAKEALERSKQTRPDLLIVDLMMEEIDSGTNLVAKLRAQGTQVPIYMLSAVGDSLDQTFDVSSLGLDGVFQKPIDPKLLLSTLRARLQTGGPA